MQFVRWFLGRLILAIDFLTKPRSVVREPSAQAAVDAKAATMALYQFAACPFCVKVRRELTRLALPIELRDAKNDAAFKEELTSQGGKHKVPCLRIEGGDGKVTWMYESNDIIAFLKREFTPD